MCEFQHHGRRLPGAAGFVDELVTAMVNRRIYSADHPRVRDGVGSLAARLGEHFAAGGDEFALEVVDGYLLHQQRALLGASMSAARLIEAIEARGGGGVRFAPAAEERDVEGLLDLLGERAGDARDHLTANRALQARGCAAVELLPPRQREDAWDELGAQPRRGEDLAIELPERLYQGVVDTMQAITIDVCRGDQFSLDTAKGQLEQVLRRLDEDPKAVMNLARYEHYDAFTFGHSIRVAFLAMTFAKAIGADKDVVHRVGLAGLMHDVGKARVPFEILQSRHRLSEAERREMEQHTVHGGQILLELAETDAWAIAAAFGHHRTIDGGGYPRLPVAARLSTVTRLVKICDVYEALTAVRPYKPGMSPVRAYRIMMSMVGHFDPAMLKLFVQTIGIYPIGTRVALLDGRAGVVEGQSHDLRRPLVCVDTTPDGDLVEEPDRELVDLSRSGDGDGIAQRLEPEELVAS